jgi:hypothetical protein
MTIHRALALLLAIAPFGLGAVAPAAAQTCTRVGVDVTCDDSRRGISPAILSPGPTAADRDLSSPHPSVIIGNKSLVIVGPGVFVGQGKGVVPMENPSAHTVLDGLAYCY